MVGNLDLVEKVAKGTKVNIEQLLKIHKTDQFCKVGTNWTNWKVGTKSKIQQIEKLGQNWKINNGQMVKEKEQNKSIEVRANYWSHKSKCVKSRWDVKMKW